MVNTRTVRDGGDIDRVWCNCGQWSLGRVATAHQIAPWSEDLTCLSHHAVGAAFRSTSAECFSHFQSDTDVAQRRKLAGRTQQKVLSAASYRAGDGHGPIALEVRKTAAERAAESEPIY